MERRNEGVGFQGQGSIKILTTKRIKNYNYIKNIILIGIKSALVREREVMSYEALDKRPVRSQGIAGNSDLPE
jgi:hypothetical protein